ncbi:DUF6510 family protein [Kribbella sp. NBC_00889]|uniref:DUF6510 family protein n=1 Tax=Kribbella sp. NBC_00889 TaxID=2975974 RepID=UPI00386ED1AF|nr:DUF6510 family protein [Kribbella sp. NBC_00889]
MKTVDGNAIAGVLHDLFGRDMTVAGYACVHCGRTGPLAELVVYVGGPGIVGRCRACYTALLVITERRGMYCVDAAGV